MRRTREERGQVGLLVTGFFMIAVLLVVVVVDASAAFLRRQRLDSLADGAALAAVEGVEGQAVYLEGLGERAEIDPGAARAYASEYLRSLGAQQQYPGLELRVVTARDSVTVRITTPLELPLTPPGWSDSSRVSGNAAAFVTVGE